MSIQWNQVYREFQSSPVEPFSSPLFEGLQELEGDFSVVSPQDSAGLFTGGIGPCIAAVARGLNKDGKLVAIGIAHVDSVPRGIIDQFLDELKAKGAVSIEIALAGGFEDTCDEESIWGDILRDLEKHSDLEILLADPFLNPFQVTDSEEFERELDVLGFGVDLGIRNDGEFLVEKEDLVMGVYNPKILRRLSAFMNQKFDEIGPSTQSFDEALIRLYQSGLFKPDSESTDPHH